MATHRGGCLMKRPTTVRCDHLYPIGVMNDYQAAANRDEITGRLAMLTMAFLTTNFLDGLPGVRGHVGRAAGPPLWRADLPKYRFRPPLLM